MPKVLVLFYSRTGNTAALADAIAEGAESVKFTEVELRRIEHLAPASVIDADDAWKAARAVLAKKYRTLESAESLALYDAVIIGSPRRDGMMSEELRQALDGAAPLGGRRALVDKVGSAFAPVGSSEGEEGHEAHLFSMLVPMMHFGMIIVPPDLGAVRGLTGNGVPGAAELAAAREQGARVAKVAEWVRHAKSHEAHGHKH